MFPALLARSMEDSIRDLQHMPSGVEVCDEHDDAAQLRHNLGEPGKDPAASVAPFNTRVAPPGTKRHYASVETEILGLVLRSAIDRPVADYLHDRIWDATGPKRTPHGPSIAPGRRPPSAASTPPTWEGRQLIPRRCCWTLRK